MNTATVVIRQAEPRDTEAMVGLLDQLFAIEHDSRFNPVRHRAGLGLLMPSQPFSRLLVAEVDGQVAAMGSCQLVVSTAEGGLSGLIEDIVVDAPHRGKGIGSMVLKALEDWAASMGAVRLGLLADKYNQPALSFYERQGFDPTNLICLRRLGVGEPDNKAAAS